MNEPNKSRTRGKLLNLQLLEDLLHLRKASPESIFEDINRRYGTSPKPKISLKHLRSIFNGKKEPQRSTIELIAEFFGLDALSLELGFSVRRLVSPKIWSAYKEITRQFSPQGKFYRAATDIELSEKIKSFVREKFPNSRYYPHEISTLFAMLDGSYLLRTTKGQYFRLPHSQFGGRYYFAILNMVADLTLLNKNWDLQNVANIKHNIDRLERFDDPETFFASQKDLVNAMTKAEPNVNCSSQYLI